MAKPSPTIDQAAVALGVQAAVELQRVAAGAFRGNLLEGVMRLRALSEIHGSLPILKLLSLAVRVGAERARH